MSKLSEIRKKLQEMEDKKGGSNSSSNESGINYKFWDIEKGATASVRFLDDANPDNPFFWKEKEVIKMPFKGIKGEDEDKEIVVQVPCPEMWGDKCPVHDEIRGWFDNPDTEPMARVYWKKRSYVFQGFVIDDPLKEENPPENPIRTFTIGPQIYNLIKSSIMDPEFEDEPTDYLNGVNFKITKNDKGGKYNDYSTSGWARSTSPLTEPQLEAIEKFGLNDLSDFMPKRPNADAIKVIAEMFEASINGELYDPARFAEHYRPYGFQYTGGNSTEDSSSDSSTENTAPVQEQASVSTEVPAESTKEEEKSGASTTGKSAQDILAMIREGK